MTNSNYLQTFENYLHQKKLKQSTIEGYLRTIELLFIWLNNNKQECLMMEYKDMLDFITTCKDKGLKPRTINQQIKHIETFYNHLQQKELISYNPVDGIRIKGVTNTVFKQLFTTKELDHLYQSYSSVNLTGKRNKVMLGLLIYQALNTAELGKLEVTHVDLQTGKINVPKQRRSNSRILTLQAHQILLLQQYITEVRPLLIALSSVDTNKLFLSIGTGNTISNVNQKLSKQLKKINPKLSKLNDIRTSVIIEWLKVYNIRQVQYMVGHRYISSTEKYQTKSMDDLKSKLDKLHPANTLF